jgi:purine-binding chemotaxis protein CheW
MNTARQYSTFFLDNLYFGVEVQNVQEVIRYQEMTSVPLASSVVTGLINLRGQIVIAIDLRRRLGLPDRPADKLPMNVVVRSDDGAVSLLVDEIGDVIEVPQEAFELPPETMNSVARELILGAYKLENRLLLVLNQDAVIKLPTDESLNQAA